jgi:ABC-2 type transport system ATP-binding protein
MTAPAISVDGLEKRYGTTTAVAGLSFDVQPGEVFGLLGPNGAGKTTTVEVLEGYRTPDAGVVRVLGLDPIREGAALRPRIGVMLQEGGLYPGLKPRELLRLFAAYYDNPEDPDRLLDTVGLRDTVDTAVRRLSGSRARSSAGRKSCSSTNPPRAWTHTRGQQRGASFATCATVASPCC